MHPNYQFTFASEALVASLQDELMKQRSGKVQQPAMSIDESGDIQDSVDYYTAKYAAADGALLWEKPYNGPANRDLGLVERAPQERAA